MNSQAMARTCDALESLQGARLDLDPLRQEIARIIRLAVPNEGWSIASGDPDAQLLSSAVADLPGPGFDLARLTLIEYASDDVNLYRDLMRRDARVGVLSQSTGSDLQRSDRGREIYQPSGIALAPTALRAVTWTAGAHRDSAIATCQAGGETCGWARTGGWLRSPCTGGATRTASPTGGARSG